MSIIAENKSRADYMKRRREGKKNFSALIDREKAEAIETRLKALNKTKTAWLEEKIDAEIKQSKRIAASLASKKRLSYTLKGSINIIAYVLLWGK